MTDRNKRAFFLPFTLLLVFLGSVESAFAQGAAILARDEPAAGGGSVPEAGAKAYGAAASTGKASTKGAKSGRTTAKTTSKAATTKTATVAKPKPYNGFTVGDKYTFLNFEVVSAEKPYHTRDAKANGASGLVQVEVLIETDGNVIQARARTGNKFLHPEAERAALASKFNRTTFGGKPARAIGFLVYRFGPEED